MLIDYFTALLDNVTGFKDDSFKMHFTMAVCSKMDSIYFIFNCGFP